jgi:hypothetical protein
MSSSLPSVRGRRMFSVATRTYEAFAGDQGILMNVSAERDELRRLVEGLPDDRLPAVLAEARRQAKPEAETPWPPSWFGSIVTDRTDIGRRHDDLLTEGFGRP